MPASIAQTLSSPDAPCEFGTADIRGQELRQKTKQLHYDITNNQQSNNNQNKRGSNE